MAEHVTIERLNRATKAAIKAGRMDDARALAKEIRRIETFQQRQSARSAVDLNKQPGRSILGTIERVGGLAGQGFMDTLGATLGLPGEAMNLAGRTLNRLGFSPQFDVPPAGTATGQAIRDVNAPGQALSVALTGERQPRLEPQGPFERGVQGVGSGVMEGMTLPFGGALFGRARQGATAVLPRVPPTIPQAVGQALTKQPAVQAASGAASRVAFDETLERSDNTNLATLAGILAAGLTPTVGVRVASRTISPFGPRNPSPERAGLVRQLRDEGIEPSLGQETGSRSIQALEAALDELPFSTGIQASARRGRISDFNRAALKRAGIDAPAATPEVLDGQFRKLGSRFEELSRNGVNYDIRFVDDIVEALAKNQRKLPSQQKPVVKAFADDLLVHEGQPVVGLDGKLYQETRSNLAKNVKEQADPTTRAILRGLLNALDNAAERSMPKHLKGQWSELRRQYGSLKTIARSVKGGSAEAAIEGDILPHRLRSAAVRAVPNASDAIVRGQSDLGNLGRAGAVLQNPIGNSGTAARQMMMRLAQLQVPTTGGVVGGFLGGGPGAAAGVAAGLTAAATVPPALAAALQSTKLRAFLGNQIAVNRPQVTHDLMMALAAQQAIAQQTRQGQGAQR